MTLSATVGIPSPLIRPSFFGIYTLLTGLGSYLISRIEALISSLCSLKYSSSSSTGIRSIPDAPLFLLTLFRAFSRFPSSRICSRILLHMAVPPFFSHSQCSRSRSALLTLVTTRIFFESPGFRAVHRLFPAGNTIHTIRPSLPFRYRKFIATMASADFLR